MMTLSLLLAVLFFGTGFVTAIITIIKKIRRKSAKISGFICGGSFLAVFLCIIFLIGIEESLPAALLITGMIFLIAAFVLLIVNIILRIAKKPHKIQRIADLSCLGLCILMFVLCGIASNASITKMRSGGEVETIDSTITALDFEVKDGDTPIEVVTDQGFDLSGSSAYKYYRQVYDRDSDGLLLDQVDVTPEMCIKAIQNSATIADGKKDMFCDFVQRIADKYPDADLDILYKNLPTLQAQELNKTELLSKTKSLSAYACYLIPENTIYLPEGSNYEEGTWDYQVLIHEFTHACRTSWYEDENYKYRFQFNTSSDTELLMESMNSAFSCSLLSYYEPNIAYQMPSNYLRIMLECMDNYDLSDYMNHSDTYYFSKLDEYAGYTNYASVIWKLITLQRTDWEQDKVDIPAEKYEPIYDFLCELYYGKYLTDDMTDEEAMALADELAEKVGYDCPDDYKFEKDYFAKYMEDLLVSRSSQ